MNLYQPQIDVRVTPKHQADKPNGEISFDHLNPETGLVQSMTRPVWIKQIGLAAKGMGFHTHRDLFRQLAKLLGFTPDSLTVKTHDGVRVYSHSHHRSVIEKPLGIVISS